MESSTYADYKHQNNLHNLRVKLTGMGSEEPALAEWEWELLYGGPRVQIILTALLTNGDSVSVYNVVADSWKMERGFLAVEAEDGDEIHYIPNVLRFYTTCE